MRWGDTARLLTKYMHCHPRRPDFFFVHDTTTTTPFRSILAFHPSTRILLRPFKIEDHVSIEYPEIAKTRASRASSARHQSDLNQARLSWTVSSKTRILFVLDVNRMCYFFGCV